MAKIRPVPEILYNSAEQKQRRGYLKIFFGYASGSGKTYTMLQAAMIAKEHGVDAVSYTHLDVYKRQRVSSVNYNTYTQEQLDNGEYAGVSSGSFNYGNSNPDLEARIQKDLDEFLASHPGVSAEDVPADLLTASGSGLDPHISPKAAQIQIPAVAENSGLSEEKVAQIVEDNTEHKVLGVFGEDRVNVLKCNLAIAEAMGIL